MLEDQAIPAAQPAAAATVATLVARPTAAVVANVAAVRPAAAATSATTAVARPNAVAAASAATEMAIATAVARPATFATAASTALDSGGVKLTATALTSVVARAATPAETGRRPLPAEPANLRTIASGPAVAASSASSASGTKAAAAVQPAEPAAAAKPAAAAATAVAAATSLVASAAPKNAADVAAHNDATTSREAVSLARSSLALVPSSVLVASLRSLDLSHNLLISLPAALTGLRGLEYLDVRHNRLASLPAGLGVSQPRLQLLVAHNSELVFELPPLTASSLFRDADFPATAASLFRDPSVPWGGHPSVSAGGVVWKRPHEICTSLGVGPPQLFVDGSDSSDVVQGLLGDCWLLSAIAVAMPRAELRQQVFAFNAVEAGRPGSFTAQLWVCSRWERVTMSSTDDV